MGLPLMPSLDMTAMEIPHTISYAILYREKINSFNELPKDKRPPRNLWDKPYKLQLFFDEVFDYGKDKSSTEFIEFDLDEVE